MSDTLAPFFSRMKAQLGDDFPGFAAALNAYPVQGVRLNSLKLPQPPPPDLPLSLPFDTLRPIPWCPAGFSYTVTGDHSPGKHPFHAAGLYYLQDPSAMAVAEIAAPRPGERVLDLSAAPGGKATHLASLMQNEGVLIANEIHPQRVWDLAENLERWGARQAVITCESPARLADRWEGYFDLVVVDAPCSGEGMFRKSEAARDEWSPELVQGCAVRQDEILIEAARLVRPGGRLVYSTCTFAPDENEGVIGRFLAQHPDFSAGQILLHEHFSPAEPTWADLPADHPAGRAVRLWPHRLTGEGHFVALLQRQGDAPPAPARSFAPQKPDRSQLRWLEQWAADTLTTIPWSAEQLHLHNGQLTALPPALPDLSGLRLIRSGWWLGTLKKNRFEPSHALALALPAAAARHTVELPPNQADVTRYLQGHVLDQEGADGWTLVTTAGFGLGWGKRVQGRVKNHYPKGLRVNN